MAPCEPVTPCGPVGPGTVLATPVAPVGPCGPVGPGTVLAAPVAPTSPVALLDAIRLELMRLTERDETIEKVVEDYCWGV